MHSPWIFTCTCAIACSYCTGQWLMVFLLWLRSKKKKFEFLGELEFRNTMPDPPFDPKLRQFTLPPDRCVGDGRNER